MFENKFKSNNQKRNAKGDAVWCEALGLETGARGVEGG